jgi:hypothetical protein
MPVTISARVPEETAEHLRMQARHEDRTVSEIVNRAIDEYIRSARFPGIFFITGGSGQRKPKLIGGPDLFTVVFTARSHEMDVERTADYLQISVASVRLALAYYAAYPEEIDERFRYMEEFANDPQRFWPSIRILNVSDLGNEDSTG